MAERGGEGNLRAPEHTDARADTGLDCSASVGRAIVGMAVEAGVGVGVLAVVAAGAVAGVGALTSEPIVGTGTVAGMGALPSTAAATESVPKSPAAGHASAGSGPAPSSMGKEGADTLPITREGSDEGDVTSVALGKSAVLGAETWSWAVAVGATAE